MKIGISEISDRMLSHHIKRCHRILKDGSCTEHTFKQAEKALPILRQENDRRKSEQSKDIMHNLIHTI